MCEILHVYAFYASESALKLPCCQQQRFPKMIKLVFHPDPVRSTVPTELLSLICLSLRNRNKIIYEIMHFNAYCCTLHRIFHYPDYYYCNRHGYFTCSSEVLPDLKKQGRRKRREGGKAAMAPHFRKLCKFAPLSAKCALFT